MKTRRKRAAPKARAKSVQKKKAPAAAPPIPTPASPEDRTGIETLAAATEAFAAAAAAAPPPPTASGGLNATKKAFLNLVGQIAQESIRPEKTSDVGHHGIRSRNRFSSSPSSSSSGDDNSFRVHGGNSGMVEQGIDWRGDMSGRKHGGPTKGYAVHIGSSLQVTSLSGLHPWSSKDRRSKKSCHDPRYNDKELNICLGVIKKIMDMDEAASFSAPVDPVPLGFANRIDIPMDFGTICSNLQNGFKYLNSDDVYKDVECIWAHCLKYNKKGDYIVYLMKRVKKKFLKYWTSAGLRTEMQKPTGQHEFLTSNGHMMGHVSISPSSYDHQALVKPSSYSHHAQVPPSSYNQHMPPSSYSYRTQVPPSSYDHHSQVPPSIYDHHSQSQVHPSSYSHQAHVPPSSYRHLAHIRPSSYSHQAELPPSSYSHQAEFPPSSYNHQTEVPPSSYNHQSPAHLPSSYSHQSLAQVHPSGYSHQAQGTPSSFNHHDQVPPSSLNQKTHVPPSNYDNQAEVPPSSSNHQARVPTSSYSHEVQEPLSSYNHHSQLHLSSYSQQAQVPPSSYNHHSQLPQLQPTTNDSLKLPELQPRINGEDAGSLDSPFVDSVRKRKKDSARDPIMAKSSHSKHQPKSTLHYLRRRDKSPSQRQQSMSLVQENDVARPPVELLGRSDLGQNGLASTDAVIPIETNQSQLQPQQPPVGYSHEHVSQIPNGNIGQPQHSEWFASASHAGDVNGLERGGRQDEGCSNNCPLETATPSFQQSPSQHYEDHSSPGSLKQAVPRLGKRKRDLPYRRAAWDTPDGSKMVVPLNDLGQAFGPEGRKLASFLGTLVRDGNLAPVTLVHWSRVPKENKETMWLMVQAKFEIDPVLGKSWVMKSLSTKWRNWKAALKADYFSYKTDEERMRNLDKRVLPDQWPVLISYWNKEEVQLYAARQKANRANLKGGHTSGSKSYATLREEERAKRADGKAPTRAELYVLTHTRKDGNPVSEKAAEVIAKLQEKASEKQQESEASDSSRDTFCEVMGEEKNSHVRMCGLGPTPNTLFGRKCGHIQFAKMAMDAKKQADDEANKVYQKVEVIEQKYNCMEAQIARMNANMELMLGKMGVPPVTSISARSDQVDKHTAARQNPHQAEKPSSSSSSSSHGADQVLISCS
ncbi:unnamed protein product [Linum trigynum]|uniref:Bromo domain-containing protein n=1 Tax=Linum trigynum TaxID=586398 RepID=A0AAV2CFB9_9ROSI